jgi:T4 RnlA family RNA ligase
MTYQFPRITHIDQVLKAIEGHEEFVIRVNEEHDYTIINYAVNFDDTFPPVTDERTAILRECRGVTFRTSTGEIISRKYHKFFNLGERPETLPQNIDWSIPYRRFEKLDGSMITPLLINGEVRWATKMGLTDVAKPVDRFTKDKVNYHEFAKYWMSQGWTPIFEWCSREQRIVIDYPDSKLILTAIRENITGEYKTYEEMKEEAEAYDIPLVYASYEMTGFDQELLEEIRALEGAEGDVWRDINGHARKLKGEWYCQIHKTLEHMTLEKDVIRLIIDEKLDDAKPFLPEDLVAKADEFGMTIFTGLKKLASDLYWEVQADFDNFNGSKKKFAEKNLQGKDDILNGIKFWMWDRLEEGEAALYEYLVKFVGNKLASQSRVDSVRHLWGGLSWYDLRDAKGQE